MGKVVLWKQLLQEWGVPPQMLRLLETHATFHLLDHFGMQLLHLVSYIFSKCYLFFPSLSFPPFTSLLQSNPMFIFSRSSMLMIYLSILWLLPWWLQPQSHKIEGIQVSPCVQPLAKYQIQSLMYTHIMNETERHPSCLLEDLYRLHKHNVGRMLLTYIWHSECFFYSNANCLSFTK